MTAWIRVNWPTIASMIGAGALLAVAKFVPALKESAPFAETLMQLLTTVLIGLVPGFRAAKRKDDP